MERRTVYLLVVGSLLVSAPAFAQQNIPPTQHIPPTKPVHELSDASRPDPSPLARAGGSRAGLLERITQIDSLTAARSGGSDQRAVQTPAAPGAGSALGMLAERDTTTLAEYLLAQRAFYRFRSASYMYTMRVYEWQQLSSQLIFGLVVLLVLAGLYFSWLQFRDDIRHRDMVDRLRADARRLTAARPVRTAAPGPGAAATPPAAGDAADVPPSDDIPAQHHLKLGTSGIEVSSSVLGIVILVLSLGFFYLYLVYVYPISEVK